jgi:phosphate/sulfate permease
MEAISTTMLLILIGVFSAFGILLIGVNVTKKIKTYTKKR